MTKEWQKHAHIPTSQAHMYMYMWRSSHIARARSCLQFRNVVRRVSQRRIYSSVVLIVDAEDYIYETDGRRGGIS